MANFINWLRESEGEKGRVGATMEYFSPDVQQGRRTFAEFAESGWTPPKEPSAHWQRSMSEAQRLIDRAMDGDRRASFTMQEAMTTADFPYLFGDVLDRSVLANYAETPYSWDLYCYRKLLSDTRLAKMFRIDRGASVLDGPIVPSTVPGPSGTGANGLEQITEYPMSSRVATNYTDQLFKFGRRMDYSFETFLSDDLDALRDTPALLGRAARRTEEKRAAQLFMNSSGPLSTLFSTANRNILNNTTYPGYTAGGGVLNPPFSPDALAYAINLVGMQRDLDGEPISIEDLILVYGPGLKATVNTVLGAKTMWTNSPVLGGTVIQNAGLTAMTSGTRIEVANWMNGLVRPALNYYIPIVDTTFGNTSWYLFVDPNKGRPALQLSFLRGRETPQMFMGTSNQVALGEGSIGPGAGPGMGGGLVNPMEGDFESDAVRYKVRVFLGGTPLDPSLGFASKGTGS